ncbi:MAG: tail fiber domain-containing protein [bacterium]|nr:tail fiber domain-containing protein [bacterium]
MSLNILKKNRTMQVMFTQRFKFYKGAYYVFLFFAVSGFSYIAFAVPPATPYTPGATLDPGCVPGGVNCTVSILPSGSTGEIQFNASGALSSDTNFFWDNTNKRLGIGTTSPYAKLSVVGETVSEYFTATSTTATSTFGGAFSVGSTTPGGSSLFSVGTSTANLTVNKSTGYVGIGTANPLGPLHVISDISNYNVLFSEASTDVNGVNIVLRKSRGTHASPAVVEGGDVLGTIGAYPYNGSGFDLVGSMRFEAEGAPLGGQQPSSRIVFSTQPISLAGTSPTERMRIDSLGNVGISTTSPWTTLSVSGSSDLGNFGLAGYFTATSTTATSTFGGAFSVGSTTPDGSTLFSIGTSSPLFTVSKNSGNVGIGTASPGDFVSITKSQNAGVTASLENLNSGSSATIALTLKNNIGSIGSFAGFSSSFTLSHFASRVGLLSDVTNGTGFDIIAQKAGDDIRLYTGGTGTANERLRIGSTGNVGIGTTSPYAKLSVVGEVVGAYFTGTTTATSTFGGNLAINGTGTTTSTGGFNISAGCFAISGTCVGGTGGSLTGSGAANRASFWTTASNISYDDAFTWDNTNKRLGIGTTSPYAKLSVVGEVVSSYFTSTSTTATSTFANHISIGSAKEYRVNGVGILTRDASSAIILGDLTGNARGSFALDLQSGRSGVAVVASGADSSAVGSSNTAGGTNSSAFGSVNTVTTGSINASAFGRSNIASNESAASFGTVNDASGNTSSAFGYGNTASNYLTVAFGLSNNVSGSGASAFGSDIINSIASSTMVGPSNTAKLTILFSGNTGIATTSPYSKLTIWGNGTTASTTFEIANNASTTLAKFLDNGTGYFLGNIGIGTTSPWRKLSVTGTVGFDGLTTSVTGNAVCVTANKEITDAGAANCVPSSIRFKENITTLPMGTALDSLRKMAVKTFTYKKEFQMDEQEHIGLIAEDLETIDPRLVVYNKNDGMPWSIHFEEVTGLLVQATQELDMRISAIEARQANTVAIRGSASEWSIDENGKLVVEELEVRGNAKIGSPSRRSGVTLYDDQTGTPYCLTISDGLTKTTSGECGSVITIQSQIPSSPIVEDTTLPESSTTSPPVAPTVTTTESAPLLEPASELSSESVPEQVIIYEPEVAPNQEPMREPISVPVDAISPLKTATTPISISQ